mmetsp:Transcript_42762/g.62937  ORF Transcript_42762/g.62937 Transcript_42762/m.62937 type:complete len:102 (-) Transcript_42762:240-545(-)
MPSVSPWVVRDELPESLDVLSAPQQLGHRQRERLAPDAAGRHTNWTIYGDAHWRVASFEFNAGRAVARARASSRRVASGRVVSVSSAPPLTRISRRFYFGS